MADPQKKVPDPQKLRGFISWIPYRRHLCVCVYLPVVLLGVDVEGFLLKELWAGERDPLAGRRSPRDHHDDVPAPAPTLTRQLDHRVPAHLAQPHIYTEESVLYMCLYMKKSMGCQDSVKTKSLDK